MAMMAYPIKPGARFYYIGPGAGRALSHTVVSVTTGEIVTWSDSSAEFDGGGMSWLGPPEVFVQQFRPEKFKNN